MMLSFTEAIQSFISNFNQYSLVDPSWGNIPSWVWQGVSHWFSKSRRRVWHRRHFGNWSSWKWQYFIFHPEKHKRNWKIVSTINVTYAPIQINWARNIASNYFSHNNLSRALPRSQMLWFFSVNYVINSGVQPQERLNLDRDRIHFLVDMLVTPAITGTYSKY